MTGRITSDSGISQATLAGAIVNTLRVPLLVLNGDLRVITASPSFSQTFMVLPDETSGRLLCDLGNGQWDIPALRHLLENVIPRHTPMEAFEVEHDFPEIGRRVMSLDAREIRHPEADSPELLLVIEDITERRVAEREQQDLLRQKELLLAETQHRINNSLQIITNILLLKAQAVRSKEVRRHLQDAHERVVSVVTVQNHLQAVGLGASVAIGPYLSSLCASLGHSMISERRPIALDVQANGDDVRSGQAVRLGLITTELVINALKHAFGDRSTGRILVNYVAAGEDWGLSVADDGIGLPAQRDEHASGGLGAGIVEVLARQLGGWIEVTTGAQGTTVAILGAGAPRAPSDPTFGPPRAF
jgi:two-component sensor histidine kinase